MERNSCLNTSDYHFYYQNALAAHGHPPYERLQAKTISMTVQEGNGKW
jgi:hypothetical protein